MKRVRLIASRGDGEFDDGEAGKKLAASDCSSRNGGEGGRFRQQIKPQRIMCSGLRSEQRSGRRTRHKLTEEGEGQPPDSGVRRDDET